MEVAPFHVVRRQHPLPEGGEGEAQADHQPGAGRDRALRVGEAKRQEEGEAPVVEQEEVIVLEPPVGTAPVEADDAAGVVDPAMDEGTDEGAGLGDDVP